MKLKDNYPDRAWIWCCKSDIELITWNTVTMGGKSIKAILKGKIF